ncbi:MAG: methyl-accepting chemotaxis protein [Xanthobacteraceae bacterium]
MLLLVGVTLSGYAVFGVEYYLIERAHRALLKNNSTYIEFEDYLRSAAMSLQVASFAATGSPALSEETLRSAAADFVDAALAASDANKVPALKSKLEPVVAGARLVEAALAGPTTDLDKLRHGLDTASQTMGLLVAIAGEGRKAEWDNLLAGSESNFEGLIALICAGSLVVGGLGYLIIMHIKRTFAEVIRINSTIADGKSDIVIPSVNARTEAGQLYAALRVFRDNAVEKNRLEAAARTEITARAIRQKQMEVQIANFRGRVQELLAEVVANMEEMQTTAESLAQSAGETSNRATGAATASDQASAKARAVASAAEALAVSIDEINRQVRDTTSVVLDATEGARATNASVAGLAKSAQTIGEIVDLIRDVAEQTNLLALNATIEAARAGDMGRGFAVVATEVKSLAQQTANATGDIAAQIAAIQASTTSSVDAIKTLAGKMEQVNSYASSIAKAVERQGIATAAISDNVQQAASETQKVAVNMTGVTSAVRATSDSAMMVERASSNVVAQTAQLRSTINQFLEDVAAA